jgi:Isochorismatase family
MYTLVIIDMQDRFAVRGNMPVSMACMREIKQAIKDEAYILAVEFHDRGPTIPYLSGAWKDYSRAITIEKRNNDGSEEIKAIMDSRQLPNKLKITGVNTGYCVYATVIGLSNKMPDITQEVIADACTNTRYEYQQDDVSHKASLELIKTIKNVTVKNQE